MKKIIFTPMQILILCVLTILGISMFFSDGSFKWDESGTPCTFSYIEQGTYALTVSCSPVDQINRVTVFSGAAVDADGEAGVMIAQADMEPGQNAVSIPLSLERGIYNVCVATDLDTKKVSMVTGAHLESTGILYRDGMFQGSVCFIAALMLAVIFMKISRERYIVPLCMVGFGLLAGIPMYVECIVGGHDITFHMHRIEGIYQAMRSGDFPVRLNPLQVSGYGYLSSTMYPQLFLYPIAMLRFLNVSLFTCYKFLITMYNVGTALITYCAVKSITDSKKIGVLASFLYTFSAYRLVCVYLRAAIGEVSALTFFPLIIWGLYECLWGEEKRWYILVLGMTGVLESHVLSTEICAVFMLLELFWWLCSRKKTDVKKRIIAGVKAIVITALLNLSFLIPFLYFSTQKLRCFEQYNIFANHVVYFSQMFSLFLSASGGSASKGTTVNEMPMTVGTALLIGLIIFFIWNGSRSKDTSNQKLQVIGMHCAVYALIFLFLASWLMPWGAVISRIPLIDKLTASMQFPWRLLGTASLFMVLCTSIALISIQKETKELNWLTGIVVTLCLVSTWSFFDNLKQDEQQYLDLIAMEAVIYDPDDLYLYSGSSYFDFNKGAAIPKTANNTSVRFSDYKKDGTHISTDVAPLENAKDYLVFPLYYYPGYEIRINGTKTDIFRVDSLVACELPSIQSHIEVKYTGLPLFQAGDLVSLFTGLGICCIFIVKRLKKEYNV